MIRDGIAINYQAEDGYTALYEAVKRGHYERAEWMIKHSADPLSRVDPKKLNENLL